MLVATYLVYDYRTPSERIKVMSAILTCFNCTYEVDELSRQGLCQTCQRAYNLWKEK